MQVAGDFDASRKFIVSVKIPYHAPSFGGSSGLHSLVLWFGHLRVHQTDKGWKIEVRLANISKRES